jgi:hypothetical protein
VNGDSRIVKNARVWLARYLMKRHRSMSLETQKSYKGTFKSSDVFWRAARDKNEVAI